MTSHCARRLAAGNNRHGHRDATMILMAFRHGLRASELCSLRWEQVDLVHGRLHVHRLKNGMPSVHPLTGIELRALRRLQRGQKPGRYVFMSERGAPMSAVAFRRMVTRLGAAAKMPFGIHPHMLRHSTGFKLANQGVDTRSLQHYPEHPAHGALHGADADAFQGFLGRLTAGRGAWSRAFRAGEGPLRAYVAVTSPSVLCNQYFCLRLPISPIRRTIQSRGHSYRTRGEAAVWIAVNSLSDRFVRRRSSARITSGRDRSLK